MRVGFYKGELLSLRGRKQTKSKKVLALMHTYPYGELLEL